MTDSTADPRDARGDWRPGYAIQSPPVSLRPMKPTAVVRWLVAWPGYLWPFNAFWLLIAILTWIFLTPNLQSMQTLEFWWIGVVLARNTAFTVLLYGGLHLYLHVLQKQGDAYRFTTRPLAVGARRFRFGRQVWDNMLYTLASGVPVFTAFEVLTYWGFANGLLGFGISVTADTVHWTGWAWTAVLVLLAPALHSAHFYFGHRLLHSRFLYRRVHALHHRNVDIGPWSGLAMHPLEHVVYFSTAVAQWLIALHPINVLFQIQVAVVYAAFAHTGFERLMVGKRLGIDGGSFFHNLHHQHFECNYGGSLVPLDRMFGTFHDGSVEADELLRERLRTRRQLLRQAESASA